MEGVNRNETILIIGVYLSFNDVFKGLSAGVNKGNMNEVRKAFLP